MLAYHDREELKDESLERMREHIEADSLARGSYWNPIKKRGCAVGCLIHSDDHSLYESQFGIPVGVALLEDVVFEGMSDNKYPEWPERFLEAIPVGADLSLVYYQFMAWMVGDKSEGLIKYNDSDPMLCAARLLKKKAENLHVSDENWGSVENMFMPISISNFKPAGSDDPNRTLAYLSWNSTYKAIYLNSSPKYLSVCDSIFDAGRAFNYNSPNLAYDRFADKLIELLENSLK